jgi:ubiquinol-cytochrome c reductase cytochrome b subunit
MCSVAGRLSALLEAVEERTRLVGLARRFFAAPAPPGAALRLAFYGALTSTLLVVLASGVALSHHYSPSTTHAWASVAYIERELPWGQLVRALHYQGTNALVVGLALQLLVAAAHATYRRPHEASWWLWLATLGLSMGLAMTGALLPWDEQGYWASRVETGIIASTPLIGPLLRELAQGGNDFGHLMVTRYYSLHAMVLPLLLLGVTGLLFAMLAVHGPAPVRDDDPPGTAGTGALAGMTGAVAGALAVYGLAIAFGAPLEGPADPSGGFPPRPAWYFRALYELRRHFEGPLEPIATMVIPGVAATFLVAIPLLDRADRPRRRRAFTLGIAAGLAAVAFATWFNFRRDEHDELYRQMVEESGRRKAKALLLAAQGVPPQGPLFMLRNTPEARGQRIYAERCAGCHTVGEAVDKPKGPDLAGWAGKDWLMGVIAHPEAVEYFGATKVTGMEPYEGLGKERLALLAGFLAELKHHPGVGPKELPEALQPGRKAFEAEGCDGCHSLAQDGADGAPALNGYASDRWIAGLLMDPGAEHYFGEQNDMPSYRGKLDDAQVADVTAYLRTLEAKPPKYTLHLAGGEKP